MCDYYEHPWANVNTSSYTAVPANNVEQMKAAVAKQPIAVTFSANIVVFDQYSSGIFDMEGEEGCGTAHKDHQALVVGYGTDDGTEFWIVKNSWGTDWGDKGYIKMRIRDGSGVCAIQKAPLYPITN